MQCTVKSAETKNEVCLGALTATVVDAGKTFRHLKAAIRPKSHKVICEPWHVYFFAVDARKLRAIISGLYLEVKVHYIFFLVCALCSFISRIHGNVQCCHGNEWRACVAVVWAWTWSSWILRQRILALNIWRERGINTPFPPVINMWSVSGKTHVNTGVNEQRTHYDQHVIGSSSPHLVHILIRFQPGGVGIPYAVLRDPHLACRRERFLFLIY